MVDDAGGIGGKQRLGNIGANDGGNEGGPKEKGQKELSAALQALDEKGAENPHDVISDHHDDRPKERDLHCIPKRLELRGARRKDIDVILKVNFCSELQAIAAAHICEAGKERPEQCDDEKDRPPKERNPYQRISDDFPLIFF